MIISLKWDSSLTTFVNARSIFDCDAPVCIMSGEYSGKACSSDDMSTIGTPFLSGLVMVYK